jgi:Fe-S cluster assembly protein SufD
MSPDTSPFREWRLAGPAVPESDVSPSVSPAAVALAERDAFLARLERSAKSLDRTGAEFLEPLRAAARSRFKQRGLPTTRDEGWRFTSLVPIARTAFVAKEPAVVSEADVEPWRLAYSTSEVVFVDGILAPALSRRGGVPGLAVESLRERLARDGQALVRHLTRVLWADASAFADLNTAFFEDVAVVELRPGTVLREPVHLLFFSSERRAPTVSFPRALVLLGGGSEMTLVESYGGPGGPASFTCAVTEALVEENAELRRYKLQEEAEAAFHVSSLAARVERQARFRDLSFSLGAALSRHDLDVALAAEGAETTLDGLFYADGERHTDTHTRIDHAHPHGTSRELYKGVVDGRGRGVFTGRIVVRPGAQKTDAAQTNKNLLLSREALVHSTPQLEILADDVKCRHGATTGQLDETALFYLRSRGLSLGAARSLLTVAFAADLVHRIAVPALRARVAERLLTRLPGAEEVREAAL